MTVFITPLECHFDIQIAMDVKRMEMENEVKIMKFGNHCIIYVQESNTNTNTNNNKLYTNTNMISPKLTNMISPKL
jgi:hypothetical protein